MRCVTCFLNPWNYNNVGIEVPLLRLISSKAYYRQLNSNRVIFIENVFTKYILNKVVNPNENSAVNA